jgi:hypothetical protein
LDQGIISNASSVNVMALIAQIALGVVIAAVTIAFLYIVWVLGRLGNHGLAIGLVIVAGAIIIAALVVVLVRLLDKVAIKTNEG